MLQIGIIFFCKIIVFFKKFYFTIFTKNTCLLIKWENLCVWVKSDKKWKKWYTLQPCEYRIKVLFKRLEVDKKTNYVVFIDNMYYDY